MKPKYSTSHRKTPLVHFLVLTLGIASTAGTLFLDSAQAADSTWKGTGTDLNTAGNWTAGVPNASGNTATWNGTQSGNLSLTYAAAFGPTVVTENGINLNITGTQTGSLQIGINATNNGGSFQLGSIDIASGAGAFTLGGVATTSKVAFRNTSNTQTFTNNSGNVATFGSNITYFSAGGTARTLIFGGSGNWQVDAGLVISGSGSLAVTKNGAGTLTLAGASSHTGVTTISAGTLQFAKTTSLYNNTTGSWTASNIRVNSGGTLALNVGGTNEFTTGNVTTLLTNLSASSSTSNGMNAGSSLGFDTTNASGGTFTIADNIADTTGTSGGARGLTKLGTNTLTLSGTSTYTGATKISAGTLSVASIGSGGVAGNLGQAAATASNIVFDGGTLKYTGTTATSDRAFTINAGKTATIEVSTSGQSLSLVGATGAATNGALTKTGSGTLTLFGTNTYTGATTVSGGILNVTGSIGSSDVTVYNGGTLASGTSGTIGNDVTVNSDGTLSPGGINSVGTATVNGNLAFASGSIFEWAINANKDGDGLGNDTGTAGTDFDKVTVVSGGITVATDAIFKVVFGSGATITDAFWNTPNITQTWDIATIFGKSFTGDGAFSPTVQTSTDVSTYGSFTINGTSLTWTAVPEPTSALAGLLITAGLLRRRRAVG